MRNAKPVNEYSQTSRASAPALNRCELARTHSLKVLSALRLKLLKRSSTAPIIVPNQIASFVAALNRFSSAKRSIKLLGKRNLRLAPPLNVETLEGLARQHGSPLDAALSLPKAVACRQEHSGVCIGVRGRQTNSSERSRAAGRCATCLCDPT